MIYSFSLFSNPLYSEKKGANKEKEIFETSNTLFSHSTAESILCSDLDDSFNLHA